MVRIGIGSDGHAGLEEFADIQKPAMRNAARFFGDQNVDYVISNGDFTDHLMNELSVTNRDLCLEASEPMVELVRNKVKAIFLAGNTDWVIADHCEDVRRAFFHYTGFEPHQVTIPQGGLVQEFDLPDVQIKIHHMHAMKQELWGEEWSLKEEDYDWLWERVQNPDPEFLQTISAVSGSHREDFLKAERIGKKVKPLPWLMRRPLQWLAGRMYTRNYEKTYANMLDLISDPSKKVLAFGGHTHNAGIRDYKGITVVNTGTMGAKPNPLQRMTDPKGHVSILDTEKGTFKLVQTFDARHPEAMPKTLSEGSFDELATPVAS